MANTMHNHALALSSLGGHGIDAEIVPIWMRLHHLAGYILGYIKQYVQPCASSWPRGAHGEVRDRGCSSVVSESDHLVIL